MRDEDRGRSSEFDPYLSDGGLLDVPPDDIDTAARRRTMVLVVLLGGAVVMVAAGLGILQSG